MPRAEPEKRAEARQLVERDGLSLTAAARAVRVNESTVRAWQKADEQAGDGWAFDGSDRVRALSDEERSAQVERARRAQQVRWANRREGEADAAGLTASATRARLMDTLPRVANAVATDSGQLAVQLARVARDLAVTYGILTDKADKMSGVEQAESTASTGDDVFAGQLAEVHDLVDRVRRSRGQAV